MNSGSFPAADGWRRGEVQLKQGGAYGVEQWLGPDLYGSDGLINGLIEQCWLCCSQFTVERGLQELHGGDELE